LSVILSRFDLKIKTKTKSSPSPDQQLPAQINEVGMQNQFSQQQLSIIYLYIQMLEWEQNIILPAGEFQTRSTAKMKLAHKFLKQQFFPFNAQ
jgi:hypothetical protein